MEVQLWGSRHAMHADSSERQRGGAFICLCTCYCVVWQAGVTTCLFTSFSHAHQKQKDHHCHQQDASYHSTDHTSNHSIRRIGDIWNEVEINSEKSQPPASCVACVISEGIETTDYCNQGTYITLHVVPLANFSDPKNWGLSPHSSVHTAPLLLHSHT